jgi:CheY-like chemotaxis protein
LTTNGKSAPGFEGEDQDSRTTTTILVADDEPGVLIVAAAMLNRFGYHVLTAANGVEALRTFETASATIHVVISDFAMPGMNGHDLIRSVLELSPATGVLLMSASPRTSEWGDFALAKPFTQETLVTQVRTLIAILDFNQIAREQSSARSRRRITRTAGT